MILFVVWEPWARVEPYFDKPWVAFVNVSYFDMDRQMINQIKAAWNVTSDKSVMMAYTDPHLALYGIEIGCLAIFVVDCVLHFLVCPHKKQFFKEPFNINKVFINVCFLSAKLLELQPSVLIEVIWLYLILYALTIFRLMLVARLRKLYRRLDILLIAIQKSCHELLLLFVVFMYGVTVFGTLIFYFEMSTGKFDNVGYGIWWSLITMTTVGYGDFFPETYGGYVVGAICAFSGIIALALPISSIASNFGKYYSRFDDLEQHEKAIKKDVTSN